ncbi:hypothetical protein Tco_0879380 [Tanacetum coccineum]
MASKGSDPDAEYALSKLLQMGTVAEYHNETNPKTLDEAFSLGRAAETRFANLDIWKFLRSNPSTLGKDFFKARITEARFEIIAKEDKEHIVKKKIDVILPLPLQSEFASPEVKGSLDADEDIGVDKVSSAIDGVFDIGESLVVFLKWVSISRSRPLLLMVSFENTDVAMGKEVKIQRRIWDPGIKIFLDNTLRTRCNRLKISGENEVDLMKRAWGIYRDENKNNAFNHEDAWSILRNHAKWDAPDPAPVDLTEDEDVPDEYVSAVNTDELFGPDARPCPPGKQHPGEKTKFDTSASTGGSSSSTQFGEFMSHELRLKREAAEKAFEVSKEKDGTITRLEELRFLALRTKDVTPPKMGHSGICFRERYFIIPLLKS